MKCYLTNEKGIDSLQFTERASPVIRSDTDVLVEVKACSLNYRDLMIVKGQYQKPSDASFIPLSDMAGVVVEVGNQVTELKVGDRVLNAPFRHFPAGTMRSSWARTFIGGGGLDGALAEQIVYPAESLIKIPAHLDLIQGSTFTIAGLTAWAAIVTHGRIRPGEFVLLQGTGGVSIFASQIAHAFGAKTIMTTSNPEKAEYVKSHFGVHATVDYRDPEWHKKAKELTHGNGFDVVVDVVGGDTLNRSCQICAYGARVAVVGVLSGGDGSFRIRDLLSHQIQVRGIFMESTEELRALMRAVDAFKLIPAVNKVFPMNQVKEAYRYLESQKHIGKVVIQVEQV